MVVVKIELWPHGDESRAREIGRVNIALQDVSDANVGTYTVELQHAGRFSGRPGAWRRGTAKYLRTLSPYHLVANALRACGI